MPAITRSQMKNSKNSVVNAPIVNLLKDVVPIRNCVKLTGANPSPIIDSKTLFISEMKELLGLCAISEGQENKMKIALKIYVINNVKLSELVSSYGIDMWICYIATAYNKTTQFYKEWEMGNYSQYNKKLVEEFLWNLERYRNMFTDIIKNYNGNILHPNINEAKAEILREVSEPSTRPRRNIRRVNYAGMDMCSEDIGKICVFKPWFEDGKVIEKMSKKLLAHVNELDDEDYIFEEDQDEEEEDKKEQFCNKIWAKIHPESADMPRRARKQINYAGMDMNEDDIGEVSVCKRWFENGKVAYKWSKRSLSQANEIGDEDYVPEKY